MEKDYNKIEFKNVKKKHLICRGNKQKPKIYYRCCISHINFLYMGEIEKNETLNNNSNHQFYDVYEEKLKWARRGENKMRIEK